MEHDLASPARVSTTGPKRLSRRALLRRATLTLAGLAALPSLAAIVACGPTPSSVAPPTTAPTSPAPTQPTAAAPAAAAPTGTTAKRGGTFIDVSFGDAVSMQPLLINDTASRNRVDLVYAKLLQYNKKLELIGDLAKSYDVSDDKLAITFTLRDNLVWSDGKPLTANDVKFTFDKMLDEKVKFPYRSLYTTFTGAEVPNPQTIVFRLKEPFAPALTNAAQIQPIPKHIFENLDINQNDANTKPPVGSGPFVQKEWLKDDHATFVANERYYAGRPNIDAYTFRVVKDATVSYSMLKTGEADTSDIQPPDYEEAKASTVFNTYRYYSYAAPWDFIGFNLKHPALADKRVRQALSHALDKKKMIDRILLGFAKPQYSIYPATSPVFTEELPKFEYDPAKAKALLDDAGWKAGSGGQRTKDGQPLKLRLIFNAGSKRREQIATIAQQYWKEIGVETEVIQEEWTAFLKRVTQDKDFDAVVLGFSGGYEPHDQSNVWVTGKSQNITGYSNPKIDDLFKQGATISYDMKERKPVYVEIQRILAEDQVYIFLWTLENIIGVNKRVKGIDVDPLGLRWNVATWTIG